jgi:hypothetical protein
MAILCLISFLRRQRLYTVELNTSRNKTSLMDFDFQFLQPSQIKSLQWKIGKWVHAAAFHTCLPNARAKTRLKKNAVLAFCATPTEQAQDITLVTPLATPTLFDTLVTQRIKALLGIAYENQTSGQMQQGLRVEKEQPPCACMHRQILLEGHATKLPWKGSTI